MLSLLTCSVSRFDDSDPPYAVPPPPVRQRRVTRSLGFIKATSPNTKRRKVAKVTIGMPTDFRHELHIGKDVAPENMVTVWDTARWQEELMKNSRPSPPSSIAPSTVPSSPTNPNRSKRNSFTPQKRKPVPSLIPDLPSMPPHEGVTPHEIPLPSSPTGSVSDQEIAVCEPSEPPALLLDPPRRRPSMDEEVVHASEVTDVVYEAAPAPKDDPDRQRAAPSDVAP